MAMSAHSNPTVAASSDADLLSRIVQPDVGDWSPEAARSILAFDFSPQDHARMLVLSEKANQGGLTAVEQSEAECFLRVGDLLTLLRAKARHSLHRAGAPL